MWGANKKRDARRTVRGRNGVRQSRAMAPAAERLEPRAMLAVTPTIEWTGYSLTGPGTDSVYKSWVVPGQDVAFLDTNQGLLKYGSNGLKQNWFSPIPLDADGFTTTIKDIVFNSADGTRFADGSMLVFGATNEGAGREWMRAPGFDTSFGGGNDGYIVKLQANGSMAWGTYLGAAGTDSVDAAVVAPDGSIYVLGTTNSDRNFVFGGLDRIMTGSGDAFLVKLNANGTHAWSTYLSPLGSDGVSQLFDTSGGLMIDIVPAATEGNAYSVEAVIRDGGAIKRIRLTPTGSFEQYPGIVSRIAVLDGGEGYTTDPTVTIAPPNQGRQATARATVVDGKITGIVITDPGAGYSTTTPTTVTISGGGGLNARASATIIDGYFTRTVGSFPGNAEFLVRSGTRFGAGGTTKFLYAFTKGAVGGGSGTGTGTGTGAGTGTGTGGPNTYTAGSIQKWDIGTFANGAGDWSQEWVLNLDGYEAKAFDVRDNAIYVTGNLNDTVISGFNTVWPEAETLRVPGGLDQAILAVYRDRINAAGVQVRTQEWAGYIGGAEKENAQRIASFQDNVVVFGQTDHNRSLNPAASWITRSLPGYASGQEIFAAGFSVKDPSNALVYGLVGTGTATEILVADGTAAVAVESGTDFGRLALGAADTVRSFRVKNTGSGRLTISGLTLPSGFDVVTPPPSEIASGQSADFSVKLRSSGTTIGIKQGTLQFITNDANRPVYDFAIRGEVLAELTPEIGVADMSVVEGNVDSVATIAVSLSAAAAATKPVSVRYAVVSGTATANRDFVPIASGLLEFGSGEVSKTIPVTIKGDRTRESSETFIVRLSAPVNATLARGEAIVTITDDDSSGGSGTTPSIMIDNLRINEGNGGSAVANVVVRLSAASAQEVSVLYATADGTARSLGDYTRSSGRLTFAPGETSKTIAIPVVADTVSEGDETFSVRLSSPVNALLGSSAASVTLVNDDAASAAPQVSVANVSIREGNTGRPSMRFTLTLAAAATSTLTFGVRTADGTAVAGRDYVALRDGATVTFRAGQKTAVVVVSAIANLVVDGDRSFTLQVTSGGSTIASATGTIRDDDATTTLALLSSQTAFASSTTSSSSSTSSSLRIRG